jgi:hypothetical protein
MTVEIKDLHQTRPIALAHQGLARREVTLLDAPMADIHRACGLLTVDRWRQQKDQLDIVAKLGLIVFDNHDVIATSVHFKAPRRAS